VLDKGNEKIIVYYWYQTINRTYVDLFMMKFDFFVRKLTHYNHNDEQNLFVRVLTPVLENQEKASLLLSEYVAALFIEMPTVFKKDNI
jgi:hemerythrin superfamily protein